MKKWEIILIESVCQFIIIVTFILICFYSINLLCKLGEITSNEAMLYKASKWVIKLIICLAFNILSFQYKNSIKGEVSQSNMFFLDKYEYDYVMNIFETIKDDYQIVVNTKKWEEFFDSLNNEQSEKIVNSFINKKIALKKI